jgi:hypothetical protein
MPTLSFIFEGDVTYDWKPENYLFMGLNKIQTSIIEFSTNYGLTDKLKKISSNIKFKRAIKRPIK